MAPVACLLHAQTCRRSLHLRSFLIGLRQVQSKPTFSSANSCFSEPGFNLGGHKGLHFMLCSLGTTRLLGQMEKSSSLTRKSFNTAGFLSSLEENQQSPIQRLDSFIKEPANEQALVNCERDNGSALGRDMVTKVDQKVGLDMAEKPRCDHPWPEWVEFLEYLYAQNYFEGSEHWTDEGKSVLETYSTVRHASVAFSRERNDIFRSLSRKNLRVLANFGCPETEKKSSNSSKRLRAHFDIPEGEVCVKCKFKMSCPRAFLPPPKKIPADTLDVVRIITSFAGNASPNAESSTSYPKEVEVSVCAILKEILAFSAIPRDPTFRKESPSLEPIKKPLVESGARSPAATRDRLVYTVAEKPGDWVCSNCDFMNFARNRKCRECDVFRPRQDQEILLGDWECPKCKFLNFSKNKVCRECETERPTKIEWTGGERLPESHIAEKTKGKTSHSWGLPDKRSGIKQDDVRAHPSRSKGKYAKYDFSETDDDMQISGSATESDQENVETLRSSSRAAKRKNPMRISEEKGLDRQLPADKGIWKPNLTKRKVTMRKDAEKDYTASEDDAEFSDMDVFDRLEVQAIESEIDLSDEEDEALSQSALKVPSGKVTKASFKQSNYKGKKEVILRSPSNTSIVGSKVTHKWTDKSGLNATTHMSKASKGNAGKSLFNETDSNSEEFDCSQSILKSRLGQSKVKSGSYVESVGSVPSNETDSDADDLDCSQSKLRSKKSRLVQSNTESVGQVKGVHSFPSNASEDGSYNVLKSVTTMGAKPLFNWSESESDELVDGRKKSAKGKGVKEQQVQSTGRKVSASAGYSQKSGSRGKRCNWSESESESESYGLVDGRKKRVKGKRVKEHPVQSTGRNVSASAGHSSKSGSKGKSWKKRSKWE